MLYCVAPYRAEYSGVPVVYAPGDVVEGPPEYLAWLLRDAPGSFSEKAPTKRQLEAARNRMETGAQNRADGTMHSGNMPGVRR